MPIYEFKCRECGQEGEYLVQKMGDHTSDNCFNCGVTHDYLDRISTSLFSTHTNAANSRVDAERQEQQGGLPDKITVFGSMQTPIPSEIEVSCGENESGVYYLSKLDIIKF